MIPYDVHKKGNAMILRAIFTSIGCILFIVYSGAGAASVTITAGQKYVLSSDLMLAAGDELIVNGTTASPATIFGNGYRITSQDGWHGRAVVSYCNFRGLGTASMHALDLNVSGSGDRLTFIGCSFDSCGATYLAVSGDAGCVFKGNTVLATTLLIPTNDVSSLVPILDFSGNSTAAKYFQGNRVNQLMVNFRNTNKWLIGGVKPQESNIIIGVRACMSIGSTTDCIVEGNYIHTLWPSYLWSQVHCYGCGSPNEWSINRNIVTQHNVLRHGEWVVRGVSGEFRYNLVLDADAHSFICGPSAGAHIHHNIFARYCTVDPNLNASIEHIYSGTDVTIYNNTLDGGGPKLSRPWVVPAIIITDSAKLASLRNNIFFNFPHDQGSSRTGIIRSAYEADPVPAPERALYVDYNCFYNPASAIIDNYNIAVAGKNERTDAGFALHDLAVGGARDQQTDPSLFNPPDSFPFADAAIYSGNVSVAQILRYYRQAYSPKQGSPVIDTGDPSDGKGVDIGAVGAGVSDTLDRFGKLDELTVIQMNHGTRAGRYTTGNFANDTRHVTVNLQGRVLVPTSISQTGSSFIIIDSKKTGTAGGTVTMKGKVNKP